MEKEGIFGMKSNQNEERKSLQAWVSIFTSINYTSILDIY